MFLGICLLFIYTQLHMLWVQDRHFRCDLLFILLHLISVDQSQPLTKGIAYNGSGWKPSLEVGSAIGDLRQSLWRRICTEIGYVRTISYYGHFWQILCNVKWRMFQLADAEKRHFWSIVHDLIFVATDGLCCFCCLKGEACWNSRWFIVSGW